MLRRDRLFRMQVQELLDACLFAIAFWVAYQLRITAFSSIAWWIHPETKLDPEAKFLGLSVINPADTPFYNYRWLYLVLIPVAPMLLEMYGFYSRPLMCSRATTARMLLKACVLTTLGLVVALFLARAEMARGPVIGFGFVSFAFVFAKEELLMLLVRSNFGQLQYQRRFVLVGIPDEANRMRLELRAKSGHLVDVVSELNLNETQIERLVAVLHEHSANGVLLSAKGSSFDQVEAAIRACELEGVEVWLMADFFRAQISRTAFDDFCGQPVLVFRATPDTSWQSLTKRMLDIFGTLMLLLVGALPLGFVALLVKLTSPGPVLFRQQRSGLNGQPFTLYKFRTMVTNAEQLKAELAAMNEMTGPVFKLTNDPRVTPLGRWLRKFSIDELPQLFNVLRGEMSLVGPRPLPVDEVKRFNDLAHRRRLSVKPGLTCLWQISGRNNVKDFKDWVRLDLEYIDNWSLWLDFKILCRTVPVVLTGHGAR